MKLYSNIIHDDVTEIFSFNIRLSKYDCGKEAFIMSVGGSIGRGFVGRGSAGPRIK